VEGNEIWGVKCSEVNLSEVKIYGGMCILSRTYINAVFMWVTVKYDLLFFSLSHCYLLYGFCSFYVLINCFMFLIYSCFVFLFCVFTFYFLCSVFCVLNCFEYCFSPCMKLYIFYLCTVLPTTATGWKPICS
jgi:hypothetical protein